MTRVTIIRVVLLTFGLVAPARGAEPFRYPEAVGKAGRLREIQGVPVLTMAGSPEQLGETMGSLAMIPARVMSQYPTDLLGHFHVGFLRSWSVRAGRAMVNRFPDDYKAEFEAMVLAASVDRDDAVLGNTLFDLKKMFACSAYLVDARRSSVGGPLLGRNLDYPSLGYAQQYSLVTVCKPTAARHAFASVTFPGLIGCLSGMNDAGLSVAILEVFQIRSGSARFDRLGTPYALCYRRLLEECSTIEEAYALLRTMRRTTITNLAIADCQGIAIFEVTPTRVVVRRGERGACVGTNHFCNNSLRPMVPFNVFRTFNRFEILETAAAQEETSGPLQLQAALHAARMEGETMQTMVFDPCGRRLHLSIGVCPSSAGEMKTLELEPLFREVREMDGGNAQSR